MPPKKATKHAPPKPAAKKAAKKQSSADKSLKDTLRTYEHLGRVRILIPLLPQDEADTVKTLGNLSETALRAGAARDAADLLRAAEHYSFGALAAVDRSESEVSATLKRQIDLEYNHLRERAELRAEDLPSAIAPLYKAFAGLARKVLRAGGYRAALELIRGAEALTHVEGHVPSLHAGGSTHLARR